MYDLSSGPDYFSSTSIDFLPAELEKLIEIANKQPNVSYFLYDSAKFKHRKKITSFKESNCHSIVVDKTTNNAAKYSKKICE